MTNIETIEARIYWDDQDPNNTGWAWCTRVDGEHDDSGPLDCEPDATDAELIDELRSSELTDEASALLADEEIEIVR